MTIGEVVGLLAAGRTIDEILTQSPYLEREDVHAALAGDSPLQLPLDARTAPPPSSCP